MRHHHNITETDQRRRVNTICRVHGEFNRAPLAAEWPTRPAHCDCSRCGLVAPAWINHPEIPESSPRRERTMRRYSLDSCGEAVYDPALPED